jgi:thiol-disulfide isomerase/thioredoxin
MNEPRQQLVLRLSALSLVCAVFIGCNDATDLPPGTKRTPASIPVNNTAAPIALKPVDRAGYDAVITEHRGKVVLVDFWATWCLPCVEQLPHTLELGQRLADRGLAVVTVSCDDPADTAPIVRMLQSTQAEGATHLISQFGGSPQTMEAFEITTGAVPFYKLYDRTGRLRKSFGVDPALKTQFTPADIEAAIEQLLAE